MKTRTRQIAVLIFAMLLCSLPAARAQLMELQGDCDVQVLNAPTENSVRVRLAGVIQWPLIPICIWTSSGVRADGQTYTWQAVLIGDGLLDPPDSVDVSVQLHYYIGRSECTPLVMDYLVPYPSAPFTRHVASERTFEEPACGPPLSFQGTLSLDASNNLSVDITFIGGTPPAVTVDDLIALVDGSSLSAQRKRPLLSTLQAAEVSLTNGNCEAGISQLRAFQNKVRAQIGASDAALADAFSSAAQAVIETACSD